MRVSLEKNYKFFTDHIFSGVSTLNKIIYIITTESSKRAVFIGEGNGAAKKEKNAKKVKMSKI